jgi:hypothetical protein
MLVLLENKLIPVGIHVRFLKIQKIFACGLSFYKKTD